MNGRNQELLPMRHSLAHILAAATQRLWPEAQFGVGPTTEDGFYYDIKVPSHSISDDDLERIESVMHQIIQEDSPFEQYDLPMEEAIKWAHKQKQPFKEELLNDLGREGTTLAKDLTIEEMGSISNDPSKVSQVSFYRCGDFVDLCRGPHVASTGKVGFFKLIRVSGVYWRGKAENEQLQRIYGVAFENQKELTDYLENLQEAKLRDHRRLGQELDLFVVSDLVGPGLPLFTPRGTILRQQLIAFSEELQKNAGYEAVWAPHIAREALYKKSGHYDKYPERFRVTSTESDDIFMLKPMNCPHVIQIFASRPRSYKDMPQRYMESATMYRDEKSGELHGLSRVRAFTQDDAHAFVRPDQIESEIKSILGMVEQMYAVLDMPVSIDLSFRDDSTRYFGDLKAWQEAESIIEQLAKSAGLKYTIVRGEAAFYGPKIDVHVRDALGRRWQCATIQLDFVQPERFDLSYVDHDGKQKRPTMIHKAILGSIERFLSVYIEHTAGKFPVWLAPEQIRIIGLNQQDETAGFVKSVVEKAHGLGLRVVADQDNESVGKKILRAEVLKVPYVIVLGPKEIKSGQVVPRIRTDMLVKSDKTPITIEEFLRTVANEAKSRVSRSSL